MERTIRPISGSLNALLVLEVVVRHSSLSRAAETLGMSQPAVSRHISTLEARLGKPLLSRNNNRVVPTADAFKLANAVELGMGHLDQIWTEISAPPDRSDVTLACTFGFADQWLMSRFSDLRKFVGEGRVRVVTTDQLGDIDLRRLDAAVVWDPSRMPDRPYFPLIPCETFPICSPDFLKAHPEARESVANLSPELFLHLDVGDSGFMTWASWFAHAGFIPPVFSRPTRFNAYPFMLQAVRNGEGVGIGWRGLIELALAKGEIIRLGPTVADRKVSYFLQHRQVRDENGTLGRMLHWFESAAPEVSGDAKTLSRRV